MKIAITLTGDSFDSPIDEHFGRCAFICIIDEKSNDKKFLDNSAGASAAHGAGIGAAQILSDNGINVLITGHVGPKAAQALEAAGISAYAAKGSDAAEALDMFKAGKLEKIL